MLNPETKEKFKAESMQYIAAAFGLVAGLAWNDAIKSLIEFFFPASSSIVLKFAYAIVITIIVFFLGQYIFRLSSTR